ncbi:hypothetical protein GCM10010405_50050 [Streptomyces macrosporus]|uniref:Uncharacterized protein n=1 Tax=Streptomyces macrosporus TaxID=44032 RepID=A0ABN3KH96_9ACTN
MVTTNVNGDRSNGGWDDPIGIFTDPLEAKFRRRSATWPPVTGRARSAPRVRPQRPPG